MTELRAPALLLSQDPVLATQVRTALGADRLRRAVTAEQARAVLADTTVSAVLVDARSGRPGWLDEPDQDHPVLLLVPSAAVGACRDALVADLPHEIVVPGAPAELLATAVRRMVRAHAARQEAEQWRDRIAVVRHEMATPLSAIEGFLDVLLTHGEELPEERRRESLSAAHRNVGRLRRLAAGLNAAAKAGGPGDRTLPEVLPLEATLRRTLQDLGPQASDVSIDVEADVEIRVDSDALQAIVSNLVSNASKYGEPPIEVQAGVVGDHVEIAVADRGPGVPDAFRPHLFERYARADETRTDTPGTGLGLWLCASLARAMGGELRYEPQPDGSRFVLAVEGGPAAPDTVLDLSAMEDAAPVAVEGGAGVSHRKGGGPTRPAGAAHGRPRTRPVIDELQVVRDGLRAHTTVGLGVGDQTSRGQAVGAQAPRSGLRAVARATLDAIRPCLSEDATFEVEHVRTDAVDDDEYVVVTVTAATARGFERLVGVAFVRDDRSRAALCATLDALNRRIEPLLS